MNGRHWSDYTEQELARMRHGAPVRASRRSRGVSPAPAPTATATAAAEPAYPPEWLPEVAARANSAVHATTPAEWMSEQPPPSRNGTAPAGSPPAEAYPAEWLREGDIAPPRGVGLGGEGWINRKAA